jgi:hypothetical protein
VNQPLAALLPDESFGVRNQSYKLVRQTATNIDPANPGLTADGANCLSITTDEFYRIDQKPRSPRIDRPTGERANNLLAAGTGPGEGSSQLSGRLKTNYNALVTSLEDTLNSQKACPGDANLDGLVNNDDLINQDVWRAITLDTSTWWDLNSGGADGETDSLDRTALLGLFGSCTLAQGQYR